MSTACYIKWYISLWENDNILQNRKVSEKNDTNLHFCKCLSCLA